MCSPPGRRCATSRRGRQQRWPRMRRRPTARQLSCANCRPRGPRRRLRRRPPRRRARRPTGACCAAPPAATGRGSPRRRRRRRRFGWGDVRGGRHEPGWSRLGRVHRRSAFRPIARSRRHRARGHDLERHGFRGDGELFAHSPIRARRARAGARVGPGASARGEFLVARTWHRAPVRRRWRWRRDPWRRTWHGGGRQPRGSLGRVDERPVFVQATSDHLCQISRYGGVDVREERRQILQDRRADGCHRVAREWAPSGHDLEEDDAHRPDVAPRVGVLRRAHLLGRHVVGRAERCRGLRHLETARIDTGDLRDAEVEHFDARLSVTVAGDEEIGGLEVAMDDAETVRLGERVERLEQVAHAKLGRLRAMLLDEPMEVGALEVLHHHVGLARREAPDVQHLHDIGAAELHGRARLSQEALDGHTVVLRRGQHELHGPKLAQVEVGRGDDHAHAALPEDLLDAVLPVQHRSDDDAALTPPHAHRDDAMARWYAPRTEPSTERARSNRVRRPSRRMSALAVTRGTAARRGGCSGR